MKRSRVRKVKEDGNHKITENGIHKANFEVEETVTPTIDVETSKSGGGYRKILIRTITASTMAILFLGLLQTGHFFILCSGVLTQAEIFRELVNVRYVPAKEKQMPLFRTLQWSWFTVGMVYIYGDTFHTFCSEHRQLLHFTRITQYIDSIVFVMYCVVFIATVLTFKRSILKFQLSQFMWTIVTVGLVVGQCKFFATNTLNGIFWFFFPMSTVMMNDVAAYFSGITFGKRFIKAPFLAISPKKTWEVQR